MTDLTYNVLSKLKFFRGTRKTGKELGRACGITERDVQDAILTIRTEPIDGVRYFVHASMKKGELGYLLIEDIEQARAFLKQYRDRAMTYHRTEAGMKLALQYMMDKQGITGTLFERAG